MSDTRNELGDPRHPLPNGTRIDHFVIGDVLGAGGFGITYLAEHAMLGKKYAIKEYFPHSFSYREGATVQPTGSSGQIYRHGLERFTTEARILAQFKHPAIVDVAGIIETNGTAYIVLAYEQGRDMTVWLQQLGRPPTQEELDALLEPVLSALDQIHRRNLLHRDIAPDNLLIRDDSTPVLIDFGSAREAVRSQSNAVSAIVKHGYSPPEQYATQSDLQGPWTDIYSLAATIYMAITGSKPPDAMNRMVEDHMPPLTRLAEGRYRRSFLEAIDIGLALRPEGRPRTITAWRGLVLQGTDRHSERPMAPARSAPRSVRHHAQPDLLRPRPVPPRSLMPGGTAQRPLHIEKPDGSSPAQEPSIPLTETGRPDLSILNHSEPAPPIGEPAAAPVNPRFLELIWILAGVATGSIGGALCAILLASTFSPRCSGDSCLMAYLLPCIILGAVAGLAAAIHYARLGPEIQPTDDQGPDQLR